MGNGTGLFSRKVGFCGRGYGCWGTGPMVVPAKASWIDPCVCSTAGGKRTLGFMGSVEMPGTRGGKTPAGEMMPSAETSLASDDLLLIATLGE